LSEPKSRTINTTPLQPLLGSLTLIVTADTLSKTSEEAQIFRESI
jgi:hypothetical protein